VAIVRAGGTEEGIVSEMGKTFSILFTIVVMLCTSLLIAVPRTAAVTHVIGIETLFGPTPQILTSSVFFAIVFYLSLNPSTVVEKVGKYLTPVLLIIMAIIIVKSIIYPLGVPADIDILSAFRSGFIDGYQTLDVFGGLVFSGTVYAAVVALNPGNRDIQAKMAYGCAIIAGLGLLFIYGGLIYLGATGSDMFENNMGNAALLVALLDTLFKGLGPLALAFAVIFACLTTAISLTAGASHFFSRVTKGKLQYKVNVVIICVVSLLISTLGIDTIIEYAVPILVFIYPTAIVMVLLNVFRFSLINKGTFIGAGYSTLVIGFIEMLSTMGIEKSIIPHITATVERLPFAVHGFAWAAPAVICGVFGTLYYGLGKKKNS
jgi:LIVCS family branched-chain amino acid:cation transporter